MLTVEKYGGSSVATLEKINLIANNIKARVHKGDRLVVVTSAMGKTTNQLIDLAKQLNPKAGGRELDALLMTGEEQAAALLSLALNNIGVNAICLNAYQARIKATSHYQNGQIVAIDENIIQKYLNNGKVVIITGFQGINDNDDIVTLGRGGSDTTAVALAAVLRCPCEIYTDVDGVYTVDPRLYPDSRQLPEISYDDMIELASTGSGVIVTRAVILAKYYQVPTLVAQSLKEGGTKIVNHTFLEKREVTGISVKNNIICVKISASNLNAQSISSIFETISRNEIEIEMVYQDFGRKFVAFAIKVADEMKMDQVILELKSNENLFDITINKEYCYDKISLVGIGISQFPYMISRVYNSLARKNVIIYQMTTSEATISVIINKKDTQLALDSLVKEFRLGEET